MLWTAGVLATLFLGTSFLARHFGVVPTGEETVLSQLVHTVFGNGPLYFLLQFATLMVLLMASNTAFADFPRLCSLLGRDGYLPRQLSSVGHRLVQLGPNTWVVL